MSIPGCSACCTYCQYAGTCDMYGCSPGLGYNFDTKECLGSNRGPCPQTNEPCHQTLSSNRGRCPQTGDPVLNPSPQAGTLSSNLVLKQGTLSRNPVLKQVTLSQTLSSNRGPILKDMSSNRGPCPQTPIHTADHIHSRIKDSLYI